MGRRCLRALLIIGLFAAGCTEPAAPAPPPSGPPRNEAVGFTWTRSLKDPTAGVLRTAWEIKGRQAQAVTDPQGEVTVQIDAPRVMHFSVPGDLEHFSVIQAPAGCFDEGAETVVFTPAALIESADRSADRSLSLVVTGLVYDARSGTARSPAAFALHIGNLDIEGCGLEYDMNNDRVTMHRDTKVVITGTPPAIPAPDSLADALVTVNGLAGLIRTCERIHTGGDTNIITSDGTTVLDARQGSLTLTGPVLFTATAFEVRADTLSAIRAPQIAVIAAGAPAFEQVRADGHVIFSERAGALRTVTCATLEYTLPDGVVVMTGTPVLDGGDTRITSHRMKYYPDRQEFVFAKPFRVEHIPISPGRPQP